MKLRLHLDPLQEQRTGGNGMFHAHVFERARLLRNYEDTVGLSTLQQDLDVRAIVGAIGDVVADMIRDTQILPDVDTDLTTADVEILERAYVAIGAELDRRERTVR